ncbi:MAG: transposase [Thermodesulfobacteriota bacterium]
MRVCPKDKGEHRDSPLHKIIQWFKMMRTNEYIRDVKQGELKPFHGKFWQRNYYEHSTRDEDDLNKIRQYIQNNPLEWHSDVENPNR